MNAVCMWVGMSLFIFAFIFVNIAKNQQKYLQKLGKPPDEKYKKTSALAKLLFAIGITLWIYGTILTIGAGGK